MRNSTILKENMWLLTFLCAFLAIGAIADRSASAGDDLTVFSKCCPKHSSLVKFVEPESASQERYECVNSESAWNNYNISQFSALVVADGVVVRDKMPDENCDDLRMIQLMDAELDTSSMDDLCYDRLVSEIINGTEVKNIPITVALRCFHNETDKTRSRLRIERIRRCCKPGQAYDTEYHVCVDLAVDNDDDWLIKQLKINDSYIYEVKSGLACKNIESAVELTERMFKFEVEGTNLNVIGKKGVNRVPLGEWCIESDYRSPGLIARVCTQDCTAYDAYCLRKCCPVGEHYKPLRCGSLRSRCVPNEKKTDLLNASYYTTPLKNEYEGLTGKIIVNFYIRNCIHFSYSHSNLAKPSVLQSSIVKRHLA